MTERPSRPADSGQDGLQPTPASAPAMADKLLLSEETVDVSKHAVVTGTVRVSTRTETRQEIADVSLDRGVVEVTRVPVGRVVDAVPVMRTEDGTTIVPVVEERFVVVKQLFLLEEIHVRHRVEREDIGVPVELRRQVAIVERVDAHALGTAGSEPEPLQPDQGSDLGVSHGHS